MSTRTQRGPTSASGETVTAPRPNQAARARGFASHLHVAPELGSLVWPTASAQYYDAFMSHRRSLSVQSKLLASFVLLTIAGITVLTAVGYVTARESLTAAAERQPIGLQRSKAGIVRAMLTSMRNEVLAFSASDAVTQAAVAMRAAHRDLRGRNTPR